MSNALPPGPLVSTEWLEARLGDPRVKVLDATWRMPADPLDPKADFVAAHIPGAQFFEIDAVADRTADLPHMAPSPEAFAEAVAALGIGDGDTVVVYDQQGLFSAARAWWTFRLFGCDDVFVLDGGLPAWREEGRVIETGDPPTPPPAHFTPRFRPGLLRHLEDMRALLSASAQVVDARSGPRFRGEAPEPRAGLRSGHMPGARNLPFDQLIDRGRLRDPHGIGEALRHAGVDPLQPVTAACGSGLTASVIALALARLGHWDAAVYDGSWSEWGAHEDCAVATGEA